MSIKRVVGFGFAVALVAGSAVFYVWWNGTPRSVSSVQQDQTGTAVLGSETKLQSWQTTYFKTSYPDTLRVIRSDEAAKPNLKGQYLLGATSLTLSDQVGLTVGTLGDLSLDELPAVKLRRLQTSQYESATRSYAPDGALIFSAKDGYETAVFWRHGGDYVAAVATGSSSRQSVLEYDLETIISSWQWQ